MWTGTKTQAQLHEQRSGVTGRNHPVSERDGTDARDGPALATTECVVSAERLMATSQIPLKSLLQEHWPIRGD